MECLRNKRNTEKYFCTSAEDVTERMSTMTTTDWRALNKSAMVELVGGVYGLTLVIIGLVFGLAAAVTNDNRTRSGQESFYLEVFQIYTFSMSLLFLAYLHVFVMRKTCEKTTNIVLHPSEKLTLEEKSTEKINLEELDGAEKNCTENRSKSTTPVPAKGQSLTRTAALISCHGEHEAPPAVTFDGKDVNFYLRLGIIAFGTGSMVQDGFRLAQLLQDGRLSFLCLNPFDVSVVAFHVLFTFFQTFYLFKSHKIVVHRYKGFVRFGFIHMMATNLSVWILTVIDEIHADVMVSRGHKRLPNNTAANATCIPEENLSWKASPYLYPCTIQYSLIAMAVICQMHRNITNAHAQHVVESRRMPDDTSSTRIGHETNEAMTSFSQEQQMTASSLAAVDCDKAHKGLFLGLLIVVLTLVSISCYFVFGAGSQYFRSNEDAVYYSGFIFFFTELTLLAFATSSVVIGFAKFRSLRFSPNAGDPLEASLLIVALTGIITTECFHAVSAASSIKRPEDVVALLSVCTSAALLLQVVLQTVFIIDTLRRTVQSPVQAKRKPGRTLITFLLLCNVSLLVMSIFEVKKTENVVIHAAFYGHLTWSIISRITLPILIFFRFHSVVCLSDIWQNAYKLKDK